MPTNLSFDICNYDTISNVHVSPEPIGINKKELSNEVNGNIAPTFVQP